jgi:hypothetical protein
MLLFMFVGPILLFGGYRYFQVGLPALVFVIPRLNQWYLCAAQLALYIIGFVLFAVCGFMLAAVAFAFDANILVKSAIFALVWGLFGGCCVRYCYRIFVYIIGA